MPEPAAQPSARLGRWPRRRLVRVALMGVALALFAGVAWMWPRGFEPRPSKLYSRLLPGPIAVAPGVYLLGKTSPAAAYLVETSKGLVLIDSGLDPDAATVIEQITWLGFDVSQLKAILLTHAHGDHCLGAEHLRGLTGAKVYAGRDDCPPIRAGGPHEALFSNHAVPGVTAHETTVDVALSGDETIAFGETRFRALASPGHSPGSVCYLLERSGLRALFAGDVIQHLGPAHTRGDLGTYVAYLPAAYRGDARAYLESLRRLRELPVPDLILPGHPRLDTEAESPRLDDRQWKALLDGGIKEMERLLARYGADGAAFLDGNPKELLPGLRYLGDCAGAPVYCLEAPGGLFLFDAPGGPALVDFLARRWGELGWQGRKLTAVLLTSTGKQATAGLAALVRDNGCQVVVAKAGLEEVRRLCPAGTRVVAEDEPAKRGWFDVQAIPLGWDGPAAVAYRVRWAGKTVLVSGRVPVRLTGQIAQELLEEIVGKNGGPDAYRAALGRLGEVKPDVWLPAGPLQGQNAFLYDDDWEVMLRQHQRMMEMVP